MNGHRGKAMKRPVWSSLVGMSAERKQFGNSKTALLWIPQGASKMERIDCHGSSIIHNLKEQASKSNFIGLCEVKPAIDCNKEVGEWQGQWTI